METSDLVKRINEEGPLAREATFLRDSVNEKERRVTLAFSSEEPYLRWFGIETLGHKPGEADMSFMGSGRAPVLDGHDSRKQIGVIEKAWIDGDRKGRAVARFSKNPAAQEVFQDIIDGIRTNISVGYEIEEMVLDKEDAKEGNSYRVTRWTPLEASVVAIPADRTVGVGRTAGATNNHHQKGKTTMSDNKTLNRESEQNRVNEIFALGDHPRGNFKEAARKAVADGTSIEDFRAFVLAELAKKKPESPVNLDPFGGMPGSGRREEEFPLRDLVLAQIHDYMNSRDAERARGRHQDAFRLSGKSAKGMLIDLGEMRERAWAQRGLGTDSIAGGGALVGVQRMPLIDALANAALCIHAGVQTVSGLVGDVVYPIITGDLAATWIGEHGTAEESDPAFGQLRMTPKTLSARCIISRRLLMQTAGTAEQTIRNIIARQFGIAIDAAILNGAGTPNIPRGILQHAGIGSVTLNAANVPDWGDIVDMETAVAVDNALGGSLAYMTGATIVGNMKQTDRGTDTGEYIMSDGKANGHPVFVSNNVPAKHILFGNWADVLVGFFSAMDVLVDPFTRSAQAEIVIQAFIDVDVIVRHAESFCKGYKA